MSDQQPLRIQSVAELVEVIPYLTGFEPHEAVVAVVSTGNQVQVTAHCSMAAVEPWGAAEQMMRQLVDRFPDSDLVLAGYSDDPQRSWRMLGRCAGQLSEDNPVLSFVVAGDTWTDAYGNSGPVDRFGVIAADATSRGITRVSSRDELAAGFRCAPSTPDLLTAVDEARSHAAILSRAQQAEQMAFLIWAQMSSPAAKQRGLSAGDAIDLAVLAQQSPYAQQVALLHITAANVAQHRQLWHGVLAQVPPQAASGAEALAGMAAWIFGDGATANVALEQMNASGHHSRMSDILDALSRQGVPPSAWEPMRVELIHSMPSDVIEAAGLANAEPGSVPAGNQATDRGAPQPYRSLERDDDTTITP